MKPDDNFGRKCYAVDDDMSKDALIGIVPPFMKAESALNNVFCNFKEISSKFSRHQNIKDRLNLYPKSLIKRFETETSGLAEEFANVVTEQCRDTLAKLLNHYRKFSAEVDKYVEELLGASSKSKVVEATLTSNIEKLLELAQAKRKDYFTTMNNDYVEGLLRGLSSAGPQEGAADVSGPHEENTGNTTNPSCEYRKFKFRSEKTNLDDVRLPAPLPQVVPGVPPGPVQAVMIEGNGDGDVSPFNQQ